MFAAIWAQDENRLDWKEDRLPWHLPNDSKFFKQMTEANALVMGRKLSKGWVAVRSESSNDCFDKRFFLYSRGRTCDA